MNARSSVVVASKAILLIACSLSVLAAGSPTDERGACLDLMASYVAKFNMAPPVRRMLEEARKHFPQNLYIELENQSEELARVVKAVGQDANGCEDIARHLDHIVSVECCTELKLDEDDESLNEVSRRNPAAKDMIDAASLCEMRVPEDDEDEEEEDLEEI